MIKSDYKTGQTKSDAGEAAMKAVEAMHDASLYIRSTCCKERTKDRRDSWDVQVTFTLHGTQYTVDLLVKEKDGQTTNARLIDKMTPIQT